VTLAGVRVGDIIRADGSLAYVERVEPRRLLVRWCGTHNTRWITAREVSHHWRLSKRSTS